NISKPIIDTDATGFCYGVKRAVLLAENAAQSTDRAVAVYGHLVHNSQQVAALEQQGIHCLADWQNCDPGVLIIRTHGISPSELAKIQAAGWKTIDATCPLVTRTHQRAEMLRTAGYPLGIIGHPEHPEVRAMAAGDYGNVLILQSLEAVERLLPVKFARLGVLIQSTFPPTLAMAIIGELAIRVMDLRIFHTLCPATQRRLATAAAIARQVDMMVVVGGHDSANTRQIADACLLLTPTHRVETWEELQASWFRNAKRVGIASGLSTPDFAVQKVRNAIIAFLEE
ncbi:MAG: 4-hydroxy-3-methylbut-2-enyl diphosphate reductase, partial [Cyanobacteria bacterium NC_groundwater_1444_Ag_S-0.65um_54_12]|nr:4-hydroxy-3-methylbut-2-enyl diphosphate reductase [Cyanobacteria bacterium NC_groundwater_1444_Ag_S-0.65um_54_12]